MAQLSRGSKGGLLPATSRKQTSLLQLLLAPLTHTHRVFRWGGRLQRQSHRVSWLSSLQLWVPFLSLFPSHFRIPLLADTCKSRSPRPLWLVISK